MNFSCILIDNIGEEHLLNEVELRCICLYSGVPSFLLVVTSMYTLVNVIIIVVLPVKVKDVVGYDTLGHCFFTEDGPEERNTFDHCLGFLVKAGTLLPSDRDNKMCKTITEGSYPGYIAKPRQDCK